MRCCSHSEQPPACEDTAATPEDAHSIGSHWPIKVFKASAEEQMKQCMKRPESGDRDLLPEPCLHYLLAQHLLLPDLFPLLQTEMHGRHQSDMVQKQLRCVYCFVLASESSGQCLRGEIPSGVGGPAWGSSIGF